jgi:O-antigen ligase
LVSLFNKKLIIQFGSIAFIGFFVLNSSKRGAILLFAFALAFFLYNNLKGAKLHSTRRIIVLLLSIAALIVGFRYVGRLMVENDYFYERYMATLEGESSHRDEIYSTILRHYYNDYNIIQMLFGGGAESTLRYFNKYAHNDWLQLLSDCGLVGIIMYMVYWIRCVSLVFKNRRKINNNVIYLLVGMAVIIAFGKTIFSMSFNSMPVGLAIALGYGMAMCEKEIQTNKQMHKRKELQI